MPKPAVLPTWASNPNYLSGPDAGSATKIAPSAGFRAEGWVPGDELPAQVLNHEQSSLCAWAAYVDARFSAADEPRYDAPKVRNFGVPASALVPLLPPPGSSALAPFLRAVGHERVRLYGSPDLSPRAGGYADLSPYIPPGATILTATAYVQNSVNLDPGSIGTVWDITIGLAIPSGPGGTPIMVGQSGAGTSLQAITLAPNLATPLRGRASGAQYLYLEVLAPADGVSGGDRDFFGITGTFSHSYASPLHPGG